MKKVLFYIRDFIFFLVYKISQYLMFLFFFLYNRYTFHGKKNVPWKSKNGIILTPNHCSNLDPPLAGLPFFRKIFFLAKESLFKGIFGYWTKMVGGIPIDRDDTTPASLKRMLKVLKKGKTLMMFPEGTRSKDGKVKSFKKGSGFIIKKSKALVVPVYIKGSFKAMPRKVKFPRPKKITVYYGKPVELSDLYAKKGSDVYQEVVDRVRNAVIEIQKNVDPDLAG